MNNNNYMEFTQTYKLVSQDEWTKLTNDYKHNDEWIKLIHENNSLKERICILEGNKTKLLEQIHYQEQTIFELRTENDLLKQKIYELENKINNQNITINELKIENKELKNEINELKVENKELKNEINELKVENKELKQNMNVQMDILNKLKQENDHRNAVFMLCEINSYANKTFHNEYKKYFNLSNKEKNLPNIGDFVLDLDNQDEEDKEFWFHFIELYPNSNNELFHNLYKRLNKNRMNENVHPSIKKIKNFINNNDEFSNTIHIVFPKLYQKEKEFIELYKNWILKFINNN